MLFSKLDRVFFIILLMFFKISIYAADTSIESVREGVEGVRVSEPSKLWDVAQFFISLEKERLESDVKAPPLDRWKLQKLCYYAQGYYLAKFGKPLFEEDLTAYYYGPYNSDLNKECTEKEIYDGRTLNQEKLKDFKLTVNIAPHETQFLSFIFNINLNKSGKMLVNESHKEAPWLSTPFGQAIERDKLKTFFAKDLQCKEYISFFDLIQQRLRPKFDQNSPQNMVEYIINEHIHKGVVDDCDVRVILGAIKKLIAEKDTNEKYGEHIKSIYNELIKLNGNAKYFFDPDHKYNLSNRGRLKNEDLCDIWPNQYPLDVLLSTLFFPKELEEPYEPTIALYGRNYLLFDLAYSARHGNLLALYHLASAFKVYESDLDGDNGDEEEGEEESNTLRTMRKELEKILEIHLKEILDIDHPQCSCFPLGELCNFMNYEEEAYKYYEKGAGMGDPRAKWALAGFQKNPDEVYRRLSDSNEMPAALIDLARFNDDPQIMYQQYLDAGHRGVSEGFHQAALMLINGQVNHQPEGNPVVLFIKAGRLGRTGSYGEAASLFGNAPANVKDKKALYRSQGVDGDPKGYLSLCKLYEDLEKKDKDKAEEGKARKSFLEIKGPLSFTSKLQYEPYFDYLKRIALGGKI